ncbi:MAG: IS21 family transposase [Gallionella sp.]
MRKIKDVLRLKHEANLSCRQIAASLKLSVGAISKYTKAAEAAGLSWPLPAEMDDTTLAARLFPPLASAREHAMPDCAHIHRELKRKGVTLMLLWEEYQASCAGQAYQYAQFCVHYRQYSSRLKLSMRQTHKVGEKLFVDYSGDGIPIVDPQTGEIRLAQVFVAVLGASGYTFAEATMSQRLPDWIGSHVRAFEFFGCLPEIVVPDNLKSAVTKPCRYEPELNASYADMAGHYGVAIIPARPYKPKDKAMVELGVLLVQRWITARLRRHTFFSLHELNRHIAQLLQGLNNRPFQKNKMESRRSQFDSLDRPAMRPLPAQSYEFAEWLKARVNIDYHIEVDQHYYSVPFQLAKTQLDVRLAESMVEVLHKGQRVASHARSHLAWKHTTVTAHMPKAHQKHLEWTPQRLLNWGERIGPATCSVIRRLMEDKPHPEMGYRSCLGVFSLSKRYGEDRLEAACARALTIGSPKRKTVQSILEAGLDRYAELFPAAAAPLPAHANVRGPEYYH